MKKQRMIHGPQKSHEIGVPTRRGRYASDVGAPRAIGFFGSKKKSKTATSFPLPSRTTPSNGPLNLGSLEITRPKSPTPIPKKKKSIGRVMFIGCDISKGGNQWEQIKGGLGVLGLKRESANTFKTIIQRFGSHESPPKVIVLGLDTTLDGKPVKQEEVLKLLDGLLQEGARIIQIYDQSEHGSGLIMGKHLLPTEVVDNGNANADILLSLIQRCLKHHPSTPFSRTAFTPIVCEKMGEDSWNMSAEEAARARETMIEFAKRYNYHMIVTGHFVVMLMMYYKLGEFFGNTVADIACGTGLPMRQFLENSVVARFRAGVRKDPMLVISVDYLDLMLEQAQEEFSGLLHENETDIDGRLGMCFKEADFLKLTRADLSELDITTSQLDPRYYEYFDLGRVDTLLLSYVIYWLADKEAAVRRISELVDSGARVITVEEPNLHVSPGNLTKEDAQAIRDAVHHIELSDYYDLLGDYGFEPERDEKGEKVIVPMDIDRIQKKKRSESKLPHLMEGRVFRKR